MHGERLVWEVPDHLGAEVLRPVRVAPVARGDGGPLIGQVVADRGADAGGSPGDQGDPSVQRSLGFCAWFVCERHRATPLLGLIGVDRSTLWPAMSRYKGSKVPRCKGSGPICCPRRAGAG